MGALKTKSRSTSAGSIARRSPTRTPPPFWLGPTASWSLAALVEFARHVCGLAEAHSSELDPRTPCPVINLMPDQVGVTAKGGTMRLGSCPCRLQAGSKAAAAYGVPEISERHRHRYEVNNDYRDRFCAAGLAFSGLSPDGRLAEIIELPDHPWFVACQFHPELKSRPNRAHPLFREFIAAARRQAGTPAGKAHRI